MNDIIITGVAPSARRRPARYRLGDGELAFAKVDLEYKPQKPDGSLDGGRALQVRPQGATRRSRSASRRPGCPHGTIRRDARVDARRGGRLRHPAAEERAARRGAARCIGACSSRRRITRRAALRRRPRASAGPQRRSGRAHREEPGASRRIGPTATATSASFSIGGQARRGRSTPIERAIAHRPRSRQRPQQPRRAAEGDGQTAERRRPPIARPFA